MKQWITVDTHEGYFDNHSFEAEDYDSAFEEAENVLTSAGYPEWCDENGYYSYDYDIEEVE